MLFNPVQVLATPSPFTHSTKHDASPHELISRHLNGDWRFKFYGKQNCRICILINGGCYP